MNETKMEHPFDYFQYTDYCAMDYDSFLPNEIANHQLYLFADSRSYSIHLRILNINKNILNNIKVRMATMYVDPPCTLVTFHLMSKTLSKNLIFSFPYNDLSYSGINPASILSAKDIQRAEDFEQKIKKRELLTSLENLYNDNLDVFDLYDSLSDEDKLKLKLTGKLL